MALSCCILGTDLEAVTVTCSVGADITATSSLTVCFKPALVLHPLAAGRTVGVGDSDHGEQVTFR